MDSSHVALVSLLLRESAFSEFLGAKKDGAGLGPHMGRFHEIFIEK
jgi:hypothetical protein